MLGFASLGIALVCQWRKKAIFKPLERLFRPCLGLGSMIALALIVGGSLLGIISKDYRLYGENRSIMIIYFLPLPRKDNRDNRPVFLRPKKGEPPS